MVVAAGRNMVLGIVLVSCMSACASLDVFQSPEERVAQRSQERLDALMARDMEKAFSFLSPAFRKTTTWQRYSAKYAGVTNWRGATVESVACQVDKCDVVVAIRYEMVRPKVENTRTREEVWIEVDGQWYIYAR